MITTQLIQTITQLIQTTTQPTQTTNIVIPPQNTTTMVTSNTTTQAQNTTTLPNIFNLTNQLMKTTTEVTAGGSSTSGGYFPHFETIGADSVRGFEVFRNNNFNNPPLGGNNNNPPSLLSPLLPPGFRGGLGGDFNSPPGGNARGLDPNIAALVNTLTGINLGMNHAKRESNHVKPTEFRETEAKDPNEWLERYN